MFSTDLISFLCLTVIEGYPNTPFIVMFCLKLILIFYVVVILLFVNGSLFLCSDHQHCLLPVSPSTVRTHLGFKVQQFYQQTSIDMRDLLRVANVVLGL